MESISSIPFFFIIGRPRSGTTLLRVLLDAHPNVVIPPECQIILRLHKKYSKITRFDQKRLQAFYDDLVALRYFDMWTINTETLKEKLLAMEGETTFDDLVRLVYLSYKSFFKTGEIQLIGDKNPGYSLYVRRLFRMYPGSKFIHIIRDYRDNYLSLIHARFEIPNVPLVVYRWKFAIRQIDKLKKKHPGSFHTVRYEDFVMEPEHHMRQVCDFLGITYDPSVFDYLDMKDEISETYSDTVELVRIHKNLLKPITTGRTGLWKKEMNDRDIRVADLVVRKCADHYGYERKYKRFNTGLYLWIMPVLLYGSLMYRMILLGQSLPPSLSTLLARFLGLFKKFYLFTHQRKMKQART